MNLVLIGLRGSGKTTLGKRLAKRLERAFVDLDDVAARHLGETSVGACIRKRGLNAFRGAESVALEQTLASDGQVVALGGGTPTAPGASDLLAERQRRADVSIAYLRGSAETLREHLLRSGTADRPPLIGDDPLVEVEAVLAERDEPYTKLANVVIDIDGVDEDLVLEALLDWGSDGATQRRSDGGS